MIIKQLSVFLENKSGRLSEVTEELFKKNINITALSIADTSEYGILRLVVSNPDEAYKTLKEKLFSVNLTDVICITVPNTPGALAHKVLKTITDKNFSVEYMYAFSVKEKAYIILRTENILECIDILTKSKIDLISAEEVYKL